MTKTYSLKNVGSFSDLEKVFIKDELQLTSMEVSVNHLPAGTGTPFLHSHKMNEELYIITAGNGIFHVDGEEFPIKEGSLIRVSPDGERGLKAGDTDLCYICIQAAENSLKQYTMTDGVINDTKASWIK